MERDVEDIMLSYVRKWYKNIYFLYDFEIE